MVEFEYEPWGKIIVHEVVKYPLEHFLATHSIGVQAGGVGRPLNWSDGFVFVHKSMPPTEDIVREQIQGRLHWNALTYGTMEKYEEVIERPGRIRIPIIDLSHNAIFQKMAEWIKVNFEN